MTPSKNMMNKATSENKVLKTEIEDISNILTPTYADIFTYPFDPEEPQLDMGVGGRLVVIESALQKPSSESALPCMKNSNTHFKYLLKNQKYNSLI